MDEDTPKDLTKGFGTVCRGCNKDSDKCVCYTGYLPKDWIAIVLVEILLIIGACSWISRATTGKWFNF
jgi:hypothetical protein